MAYQLDFDKLLTYDVGEPGISLEITLSVADFQFDTMVFFAADAELNRNVLGRLVWLDRVVLGLIDYEGKLYLSRYSE